MAKDQTMIIGLIIVFFCCCCCLSSLAAGGFMVTGTPSPAPAPGPSTSSLPSGSIKLINSETTFNNTNGDVAVANQPKGPSNAALSSSLQPVQCTISFKINSTGTDNNYWREILQNSPHYSWENNALQPSGSSPLFFIPIGTWNGQPVREVNKVTFRLTGTDGVGYQAEAASALVDNKYHTITAVADTNKITIYIDGGNPVTTTLPAGQTLKFRDPDSTNQNNKFVWNPNPGDARMVPWKIKDAYWWPRALTASEVAQVHSTTSTYMPEPLTMGTSAYTKEMYMPY